MNEALEKITEAVQGVYKKRALYSLLTFIGGGAFGVAAFMLGRLTSG